MKKWIHAIFLLVLAAFSGWLFFYEAAAEPGELSRVHRESAQCQDCHQPWKGVDDDQCLECHTFDNVNALRPAIRFHEEERYCLRCHREHRNPETPVSAMDHTLLNGNLKCTICHLDPHGGLFGANCRECHGLGNWKVPGFKHPDPEKENCSRCHRPPRSHQGEHYRQIILGFHLRNQPEVKDVPATECWRCHVTHDWRHLKMSGYRKKE